MQLATYGRPSPCTQTTNVTHVRPVAGDERNTYKKKHVMTTMVTASSSNDEVELLLRASGELQNLDVDRESRGSSSTPT